MLLKKAKLSGNILMRRRTRIGTGALLGGLIFDDRGNRMSPTYTVRRGGRYRYYVSQAQLRGRKAGSRARVGADDIERLVVERLSRELSVDGLATAATSGIWNTETRDLVQDSVDRIVVHDIGIEVMLKGSGDDESVGQTVLKAPLPAPRPRERKEILVPGGSRSEPRRIDQALILALARARSWMRALRRGEYTNTAEIAQRFGLSDAHVRRNLRLVFLAPDVVEAIVEGRQPRTVTVTMLLQPIPLAWADQRAAFGFFH
jgi:site-specific DNA recombinase